MRKLKFLPIDVFYTEDGKHTCAKDFSSGEYCIFLTTAKFGFVEACVAVEDTLNRDECGRGMLMPAKDCPIKQIA